jgi:Coenzyme PQQ synthesis protein D (PqqD)
MSKNGSVKINVPKIVHETIDGETVILNLDNGNYYSLLGVGADIWRCIEQGDSVKEIIEKIRRVYECEGIDPDAAVNEFVSELLKETLTVPGNSATSAGGQRSFAPGEADFHKKKKRFQAPVLNKYSDMQDLLLLDPIHEVDEEAGWPAKKPDPIHEGDEEVRWPTNKPDLTKR